MVETAKDSNLDQVKAMKTTTEESILRSLQELESYGIKVDDIDIFHRSNMEGTQVTAAVRLEVSIA